MIQPTMRVVMIPCRNEAATIGSLVTEARQYADAVLVADDSSADATADAARAAGAQVVAVPAGRPGLAGAYRCGLAAALAAHGPAAHYLEMDAGGSHAPGAIPHFWLALTMGADVCAGARFGLRGAAYVGHWQRKALSYGGTLVTNARHGTHFHDATSGFIAYKGDALARLIRDPWKARGHYYQTELRLRALQLGLQVAEVGIAYRNSGSSLNWQSIREAARLALGDR